MKKFNTLLIVLSFTLGLFSNLTQAQIYEPEGINMPGAWNAWSQPPSNLVFASENQVTGGLVAKQTTSLGSFYQTIFECSATGDVPAGNYNWLFTSGPTSNLYQNKWANVTVSKNVVQEYTLGGGTDNNVTLSDGKWYIVNFDDAGYTNTNAIFFEISGEPTSITNVSVPSDPIPDTPYEITITVSGTPNIEETFVLAYTTNNWVSSSTVSFSMTGTTGTASIPGQSEDSEIKYYVYSTFAAGKPTPSALTTISYNNNSGSNYSYTIGAPPPPPVGWANLQWPPNGSIDGGNEFNVYGQVWIDGITSDPGATTGLQAWVGYSTSDTDPSTWTNWVPCTFNVQSGNNDEFVCNLGAAISGSGLYYYATRYQYLGGDYYYGGYNEGSWNGTSSVSGQLTVVSSVPLSNWSMLVFGLILLTFVFIKFRK